MSKISKVNVYQTAKRMDSVYTSQCERWIIYFQHNLYTSKRINSIWNSFNFLIRLYISFYANVRLKYAQMPRLPWCLHDKPLIVLVLLYVSRFPLKKNNKKTSKATADLRTVKELQHFPMTCFLKVETDISYELSGVLAQVQRFCFFFSFSSWTQI